MFDSNPDEQNFSPGGTGSYGPTGGAGGLGASLGGIGKMIPIIVVIIIVLIAAFFAYSYFSSQKDITINLVDAGGTPAEGKITLKDSQQKAVQTDPKGTSSSFTAKLFPGEYSLTATGTGYKTASPTITVTNDSTSFDVNLTRDLKASLSEEFDSTEIYEGQTLSGKLSVTNTGQEFKTTDIVSASDSPLDVKIIYPNDITTVSGQSSLILDFNVSIKSTTALKDSKGATLAFKIKGSDITSNSLEVQTLPAVAAKDIALSGTLTNTSLTAGTESSFQITVKNNNKTIPLKDVRLEVVPDSGFEDKLSWFYFTDPSTEGKYIKMIDSIDPSAPLTTTLFVKPAITAKKDTEFHGTLVISSISMNGEKNPLTITMKVGTEKSSQVDLVGVDSPFTINCPKAGGLCETKSFSNGEIYLINKGNVDVSNIKVEIVPTPPTTTNCGSFLTNISTLESSGNMVTTLKPAQKANIIMDITAPEQVADKIARCVIQWKYVDPLSDPPNTIINVKTVEINKVVS